MGKYNFDEVIDRHGTDCLKYDFGMKRKGRDDLLPLWVADMDFRLPDEILDEFHKRIDHGIFGYTDPLDEYFAAMNHWFSTRYGYTIEPEWVTLGAGIVYALGTSVRAFTEEGDAMMVMQPVYYPFSEVIKNDGRRLVNCQLRYENNHYSIDFEKMEKMIQEEGVKALIFCNPHNPVGRVWKREELEKVAKIAREHDLILFSDEIHHDLIHQGHTHTVFAKVAGDTKMLTATAPTKTFNLAGAKVSNLIVKDPELKEKFGSGGDNMPSSLGLKLCELAYERGADWLDALLAQVKENELAFRNILKQKAPIIRFSELEGTYLLWADLRAMAQPKEDLERFVQENGIFPIFGDRFGEEGFGFIRINLAAPKEVIEAAANRLGDAIQQKACCW